MGTDLIDETLASKVRLFPNPATDKLYIESELAGISIKIFDPAGQPGFQSEALINDISGLSNGTYLVKVFDKKGKLIKVEKLVLP